MRSFALRLPVLREGIAEGGLTPLNQRKSPIVWSLDGLAAGLLEPVLLERFDAAEELGSNEIDAALSVSYCRVIRWRVLVPVLHFSVD